MSSKTPSPFREHNFVFYTFFFRFPILTTVLSLTYTYFTQNKYTKVPVYTIVITKKNGEIYMNALEIYGNYFALSKDTLSHLMAYYKRQGLKIAIWGAGARGQSFLSLFDPSGQLIECVFDINPKLIGTLCSSHPVKDYHNTSDIDLVLVMNSLYEAEVAGLLKEVSHRASILNVDHIILGQLTLEDVLNPCSTPVPNECTIPHSNTAALVILYRYDENVIQNILSYADTVGKLYLFDNNDEVSVHQQSLISAFPDSVLLGNQHNQGIAAAINQTAALAISQGYDWLLTLDQDSIAAPDMLTQMYRYLLNCCDNKTGIVAPFIADHNLNIQRPSTLPYYYCDKVIQSGALHNLRVLKEVGGYAENLFIDQVDYEYCIRMRQYGYHIVKVNSAVLYHNVYDSSSSMHYADGKKIFQDKYSPERCYYIVRNNLYCQKKYENQDPLYALECSNNIAVLKKTIIGDIHRTEKEAFIKRAYEDFSCGRMGCLIKTPLTT